MSSTQQLSTEDARVRAGILALVQAYPTHQIHYGQGPTTNTHPYRTEDGIILPTADVDAMLRTGELVFSNSMGLCPTPHGIMTSRRIRVGSLSAADCTNRQDS